MGVIKKSGDCVELTGSTGVEDIQSQNESL